MRLSGLWLFCDDGILRPVLPALVRMGGAWETAEFLVDTGADRTVFTSQLLAALGPPTSVVGGTLGGLGGRTATILIDAEIQLTQDAGPPAVFRGQFAAVTDPDALDMCVLGRDISNLLAVSVDRPGDVVCRLTQRHTYAIKER